MSWLQTKIKQFHDRRRNDPRTDLEFLNKNKREERICHTREKSKFFLSKHLHAADRCGREKRKYLIVMDVEMAPDKKFSWHEQELREDGISEDKIRDRLSNIELIRERGERKRQHMKVARYWDFCNSF